MINLVGEYLKSGSIALTDSIYKDVVTSTASERISLFVQTFFGLSILLKSVNTSEYNALSGSVKSILEGACSLLLYRNAISLIALLQFETYMVLNNETNNVKIMADLSRGFFMLLAGNINREAVQYACISAVSISIVLAFVRLKMKREGRSVPLQYYFIITSFSAYLIGSQILLEIGEKVNSPST